MKKHEPHRFIGLELAGAKNQKTALAILEYYPKEQKIFLLDIYDRVSGHNHESGDEALLEIINEIQPKPNSIGVNVPLELPPCTTCTRRVCPMPDKCTVPAVSWMRKIIKKAPKSRHTVRSMREFTPYTQRPVEVWLRYQVLPKLDDRMKFDIDEALGGNKAPLTARMGFLKRHLGGFNIVEVLPKLTVAVLARELGIAARLVASYRHLEEGAQARGELLDHIVRGCDIFIYERDLRKLSLSLAAFDAFLCAYTALLSDGGHVVRPPAGFPDASGWVQFPGTKSLG